MTRIEKSIQTEDPMFLGLTFDDDSKLQGTAVSSTNEAVGEGPKDAFP